jgi:hypothetical protein
MQQELFGPPSSPPLSTLDTSPLDGMRLKLERKIDHKKGCCRNFAMFAGAGDRMRRS